MATLPAGVVRVGHGIIIARLLIINLCVFYLFLLWTCGYEEFK